MLEIINNAKAKNVARFAIYLAIVITILFVCLYVIPHRGFDFTDHGYYLYNGFLASEGIIPAAGFAGFFNAIFMRLGLGGYYFLEIAYFVFGFVSLTLIWNGLHRGVFSLLFPMLMLSAVMTQKFTFIGSYQNLPVYFLLIGMFFLFRYLDSKGIIKNNTYLVLSAFALSLTCFVNVSLLPLAILVMLVVPILINYQSDKRPFAFLAFFLASCIIFHFLYKFSPLNIFKLKLDTGNGVSLLNYFPKLFGFLNQYFFTSKYFMLWIASAFLNQCLLYRNKRLRLSVIIYLLAAVVFFVKIQHMAQFFLYLPIITLLSFFRFEAFYYRIVVLFLLLFAANVCLVLTTTSPPLTHTIFFVPGYLLVVGAIIDDVMLSCKDDAHVAFIFHLVFLIFSCLMVYEYVTIQPYRAYPISTKKYPVNIKYLKAIKANQNKILAVNYILNTYHAYGCDNKPVVFFPAMPLLYYLVHRHAYKDYAWISPSVVPWMKGGDIISYVDNPKGYCVFYTPGFNYNNFTYPEVLAYLNKNHKIKKFKLISNQASGSYFPSKILFFEG